MAACHEEFCMLTTLIYLIDCVLVHDKSLSDKKAHDWLCAFSSCIRQLSAISSLFLFRSLTHGHFMTPKPGTTRIGDYCSRNKAQSVLIQSTLPSSYHLVLRAGAESTLKDLVRKISLHH
uniref:Uncharacterized protein n=1 Tax=Daphnia galeata TaxID=27404 RepID=A0A8J2RRY7_9CRUS|nr:unnamed protein product [Daphnia galeata]